jgi:regulator of protease activity HflC (stomatin/prohibitin superfamily)
MNQSVQPHRDPQASLQGPSEPHVEIRERPTWAINGWLGVLVVAACGVGAGFLAESSAKAWTSAPIVVAVILLASLVIVQPGQTRVVRFFGSYAGKVRRTGLSWIVPLTDRRKVSELAVEVAQRVGIAGVEIVEVRISHLAYASEIAQAMLRRQQANAVVAARTRIVDGAVGMVELALARLSERGIVNLDEERKAAMVSNLMVVLCGDQPASPIVNTGTLYS